MKKKSKISLKKFSMMSKIFCVSELNIYARLHRRIILSISDS